MLRPANAKMLVIRGGAMGDFILTLPVFAALRENFPLCRLEVLGYPHIAVLAKAGGLVDEVQPIESRALASFFARQGTLDPAMAEYFSGFAIILSFLYDPDGIFQENVRRTSRAQFIAGPHRPAEDSAISAAEVFLQPLQRLAIFEADRFPKLNLASAFHRAPPSGVWLAAHPGSGSERKNWPVGRWRELLLGLLGSSAIQVLLIGGEAEGDRLEYLSAGLPAGRVTILRSRPLVEVAARLKHCAAFVGHDSGISHLAGALGVPGVLLWGPSVEQVWRPPNPTLRVLRGPMGLEHLPVADVANALRLLISPHFR